MSPDITAEELHTLSIRATAAKNAAYCTFSITLILIYIYDFIYYITQIIPNNKFLSRKIQHWSHADSNFFCSMLLIVAHSCRPLLQVQGRGMYPHWRRRVYSRRECWECELPGRHMRWEMCDWNCCGMSIPLVLLPTRAVSGPISPIWCITIFTYIWPLTYVDLQVSGYKKFKAIAVASDKTPGASPCGMCRQLYVFFP